MSDAKGQTNEPSMEEILASIRRIIAEDGDAPADPPRERRCRRTTSSS
jgi:cell pole-organizing protein PopZ